MTYFMQKSGAAFLKLTVTAFVIMVGFAWAEDGITLSSDELEALIKGATRSGNTLVAHIILHSKMMATTVFDWTQRKPIVWKRVHGGSRLIPSVGNRIEVGNTVGT